MKYTAPELTIVKFDSESVIVASGTTDDYIGSDELD